MRNARRVGDRERKEEDAYICCHYSYIWYIWSQLNSVYCWLSVGPVHVRVIWKGSVFAADSPSIMRKCFFHSMSRVNVCLALRRSCHVGKISRSGSWRTQGVEAMLPLSVRPSTWLRGRGRDRVALPPARPWRYSKPGQCPEERSHAVAVREQFTHRAALHRDCYTSKPRAPRESRSKPYVRIPRESVPLSVIHAFFYKYIVLSG